MTTLLWIHGLGESRHCWDSIVNDPRLAAHTSLAPDLPGYGDAPADGRTLAGLADHLAAYLAEQRATDVTMIGHSMGGVIGVLLAERHPTALARLIDVDGNVSPGDCAYSGKLVRDGRAALLAHVDDLAQRDLAHRRYAPRLKQTDAETLLRHAGELVAYSAAEDLAARRAALAIPCVYVAGSPGGACARSLALLEVAGVRTISIAPSGHWPFVDQPALFARVIVEEIEH
jgi:pimeloyl-ACP methyl ester carboxylesterase